MTKLIPTILFLCLVITAQAQSPGGVRGARLWYVSEVQDDGRISWKDELNGVAVAESVATRPGGSKHINFNPALTFSTENPGFTIQLPTLPLLQSTIFTLYQNQDTITEKSIWNINRAGKTGEILTTRRLADLDRIEYMNFDGADRTVPKINTFFQHQKDGSTGVVKLNFGQLPQDYQLPITSFSGQLPEFIVYDRVLHPQERQQVESYLAIKYGTMLDTDLQASYLDSDGEVIFAPTEVGTFVHRITGIGRDDQSGLYQKQSTSSYAPGLLTISLDAQVADNSTNKAAIPDRHYLLWADNDRSLDRAEKQPLNPQVLQRQWLVKATGQWADHPTELRFDTQQLRSPAGPNETYWLLIDRDGVGDFSGTSTIDVYPMHQLLPDGQAVFQSIKWDTDSSGEDAFSIAIGPEMLVRARLEQPKCQPAQNGTIHFTAIGGRSPYQYELRQNGQRLQSWEGNLRDEMAATDLPPGEYELFITDADQRQYRETFFFQSSDAPVIPLAAQYHLNTNGTIVLNASNDDSPLATYRWQHPDGSISGGAQLLIDQAGNYRLEVEQQGCKAQKQITIKSAPIGNFRQVSLFPNPTSDGDFQLRVHLERSTPLHIRIFDTAGRPILQQQMSGNDYHYTSGRLHVKGTYMIQLQAGNDQFTLPLIVQ